MKTVVKLDQSRRRDYYVFDAFAQVGVVVLSIAILTGLLGAFIRVYGKGYDILTHHFYLVLSQSYSLIPDLEYYYIQYGAIIGLLISPNFVATGWRDFSARFGVFLVRTIALGIVLGLVFGVSLASLPKSLGLPVLGAWPYMDDPEYYLPRLFFGIGLSDGLSLGLAVGAFFSLARMNGARVKPLLTVATTLLGAFLGSVAIVALHRQAPDWIGFHITMDPVWRPSMAEVVAQGTRYGAFIGFCLPFAAAMMSPSVKPWIRVPKVALGFFTSIILIATISYLVYAFNKEYFFKHLGHAIGDESPAEARVWCVVWGVHLSLYLWLAHLVTFQGLTRANKRLQKEENRSVLSG